MTTGPAAGAAVAAGDPAVEAGRVASVAAGVACPAAEAGLADATGRSSCTVVRMKSGEPRYHAAPTRRSAETIAAARHAGDLPNRIARATSPMLRTCLLAARAHFGTE